MKRFLAIMLVVAIVAISGCGKKEQVPVSPPEVPSQAATVTLNEYYTGMDYTCSRDADCEPKNIGNCCGEYMRCVSINARPMPDLVKELCAKEKAVSICGWAAIINGCRCSGNRCEPR